jgi:hypothetical protein
VLYDATANQKDFVENMVTDVKDNLYVLAYCPAAGNIYVLKYDKGLGQLWAKTISSVYINGSNGIFGQIFVDTTSDDATSLSSGIYFYRLISSKFQEVKKMVLLK